MAAGLPFMLQVVVLLLAAVGRQQFLCAAEGMTATLMHRDQLLEKRGMSDSSVSKSEKLQQMARRNMLRVENLMNRRHLQATTAGSAEWQSNLTDINIAEYFIDIQLGTPPQRFTCVADTGSDLVWVNSQDCTDCSGVPKLYQPSHSSTYAPLSCSSSACNFLNISGSNCPFDSAQGTNPGCSYEYEYGDGSFTVGNLGTENITLDLVTGGVQTIANFQFGLSGQSVDTSSLLNETDGLVGLGRGKISLVSQLGAYFGSQFGYCLAVRHANDSNVIENLLFFGSDAAKNTGNAGSPVQYTPLLTGNVSTFYYVGVDNIRVDGAVVDGAASSLALDSQGNGGFFFDSGTTFTILVSGAFQPLLTALTGKIRNYGPPNVMGMNGFSLCYSANYSDWVADKTIPQINFQFHNTTPGFVLPTDNAWLELTDDQVCLTIQEAPPDQDLSIFGNWQQMNFQILYDLENTRIGFAATNCTSTNAGAFPHVKNAARRVAGVGTSFVTAILSLVLLFVFTE